MTRLRTVRPYSSAGRVIARDEPLPPALAIPPAWTDVWVATAQNSHILAVGIDAAGRRQYIYHPDWRSRQDALKFERARQLAAALPAARSVVTAHLRLRGLPRDRVLAAAFRTLDTAAIRIGNDEYATARGSRGLTTLQRRHAVVEGEVVRFSFPAKSGKRARVEVRDRDLAVVMARLVAGAPASRLLSWGEPRTPVRAGEVNEYIRDRTGSEFTAKDFRTLKGTLVAAEQLAGATANSERERRQAVRDACVAVAEALGNTPAIARASYIDPEVLDRFGAGQTLRAGITAESAYLELVADTAP